MLQQLDDKTPQVDTSTDSDASVPADPVLPEKKYMGYTLLGSICIPSVGVRLPVLDQWSEDMRKVAPCRYQGSISGGNMIIMGHNYKSHFNPLHKITVGAEVAFENTVGRVFCYRVVKIGQLHRNQGEKLPTGEYPLTLFTCTTGGIGTNRSSLRGGGMINISREYPCILVLLLMLQSRDCEGVAEKVMLHCYEMYSI